MSKNKKQKPDEVDHVNRGHAEFSPSGIKPISVCSGYHGRDGQSKAALLGTYVHEALETLDANYEGPEILLITDKWVQKKFNELKKEVAKKEGFVDLKTEGLDFEFTDEDIEDMNIIFNDIKAMEAKNLKKIFGKKVGKKWKGTNLFEIQLDMVLPLEGTDNFGTCDRLTIDESGTMGLLADYKTGESAIDWPRENYQAINYAIGVFQRFPDLETLHFSFYVPKNTDKPMTDTFKRSEVGELALTISTIISEAQRVRPMWEGGEALAPVEELNCGEQCRFCRYVTKCPAVAAEAEGLFGDITKEVDGAEVEGGKYNPAALLNPDQYPEDAAKLWKMAKRLSDWIDIYKKEMGALANSGVEFDGLELKSRAGRVSITNPAAIKRLAVKHGALTREMNKNISPPMSTLKTMVADPDAFIGEAIENDLAKRGDASYFLQVQKVPTKKESKAEEAEETEEVEEEKSKKTKADKPKKSKKNKKKKNKNK